MADLRCTDLSKTDLSRQDLSYAQLQNACLLNANLSCSKFEKADLSGADLRRAILKEAAFSGASLKDAVLVDAEYLGLEFAGSDMTGAKLSRGDQDFKPLSSVAEISIVPFYFSAPLILLTVYIYFHFYLHHLWKALAMLPAKFPDGRTLDEQAYPWLVNAIVRRQYTILAKDESLLSRLEVLGTVFLAWWAVPFILLRFWLRYLPRHDWVGTGLHLGFFAASISLAIIFYISAVNTISRSKAVRIKKRILPT